MTIDEAIKHCEDIAKSQDMCAEISVSKHAKERISNCAAEHRQLAEWLKELKDLREERKVLTSECDRLIKEKGELNRLKEKAVLDICRREARLKDAKRLLKAAVEDIYHYVDCLEAHCDECCCDPDNHCHWKHEAEALKLLGGEANEKP